MASSLAASDVVVMINNSDNTELELLGLWGETWDTYPEGNILPNQNEMYMVHGVGRAGIWYRAIDVISRDEIGFVNMSFSYSITDGISAEGTHKVQNRFISSGLENYSESTHPHRITYRIGEDNKAHWNSGSSYKDVIICDETMFHYGRAWVRIHNESNLDLKFDRYWNDNSYGARNWCWEPSSKDVPHHGSTRTVILRNNYRAGLSFCVDGTDGMKFTNLSFICPYLLSNSAEGCENNNRFISPGLQTYEKHGKPVYLQYKLGTPNLASWGSGISTGTTVCPQTIFSNPEALIEQSLACHRVFVLIGRVGAGKTSLTNLLIQENKFIVEECKCPHSVTRTVQSCHTVLARDTIREMGLPEDMKIKIKVTDQPGMGDGKYKFKEHSENLIECLNDLNVKTFPTFLIVIDSELDRVSEDRFLLLTQLSELLMKSSYNLFSNAVVVFTHADMIDPDINSKERLMHYKGNSWQELPDLLEAVNDRYIFVNTKNTSSQNRSQILKNLFELSKLTLHIRFHGNNDFPSRFLQVKLDILGDVLLEEPLYKLSFQFHPELNVTENDEFRAQNEDLDVQIMRSVNSMISLGEGVSAMVVLISLGGLFSDEMNSLISDLPNCYISEEETVIQRVNDWWRYVFIVFKVHDETTAKKEIESSLKNNPTIKSLVKKAGNKWTWISDNTPVNICRDRMIETCLKVRKDNGGKVFIKNTVINELKANIGKTRKYQGPSTVALFNLKFQESLAKGAIHLFGSNDSIVMRLGSVPLQGKISVSSIRLILRGTTLSKEVIQRFGAKYTDPHEKVSIKEVLYFLAKEPTRIHRDEIVL